MVEHLFMISWVIGSIPHGGSMELFLIQPVLHNWCNKGWYVLSSLWSGSYKKAHAANKKRVGGSGFPL